MASFADAYKQWADLDAAAKTTASARVGQQAEDARRALTQHPDAVEARGYQAARVVSNRTRGWL